MSFQGDRIDLAYVVGFRGGVIGISIFYDVARSVVSEVRHSVVEKCNRPENAPENTFFGLFFFLFTAGRKTAISTRVEMSVLLMLFITPHYKSVTWRISYKHADAQEASKLPF